MPGRRAPRPVAKPALATPSVDDVRTERALGVITAAVREEQARTSYAIVEPVTLRVGRNAIPHSLGRAPRVVHVTKTVADASFDYALVKNHAHAARQVVIDVIGVDQPGCSLFLM